MKIAGWEVPQKVFDAAERRMRASPFDVAHIRDVVRNTNMLPGLDNINARYIREEIGTRLIAHFKRAGKIQPVPSHRLWTWAASKVEAK